MEDYKKLLTDLYTIHDPERIKQIDYFLKKYKGKERQFYISQQTKYKSKKPISDSKKIIEEALARIKSQSKEKSKIKPETKKTLKAPKKSTTKPITEGKSAPPVIEKKITKEAIDKTKRKIEKAPEEKVLPKAVIIEKPQEKAPPPKPIEVKRTIPPVVENKEVKESVKETEQKAEQETPSIKTTTKDIWFDKKEPSPIQTKASYQEKDKHFQKKYFLYILGMVFLVIILALIAFFIFFYSPTKDNEKTTEKPKTTITKKSVKAKPNKITKPSTEKKTSAQQTSKPATKTTPKKQTTTSLSRVRITTGDLKLPAYFVACYAVKTENHALRKVKELKAKGFAASYYWIPDFTPQGNTYFKVVIGPFTTRIEAIRKLTPVQEKAEFDAYVLELN